MSESVSIDAAISSAGVGSSDGGDISTPTAPSSPAGGTPTAGPSVGPSPSRVSSPTPEQQAVQEALKVPGGWKKDYHSHWETLDPNLQKFLHEREQQFSRNASEWGNQKAQYTQQLSAYNAAMYNYNDAIEAGELTEQDVLNEWAVFDRLLNENPQLAILNIAAQNKINLAELAQTNPMQHENMVLKTRQNYQNWDGEAQQYVQQREFAEHYASVTAELADEIGEEGNPVRPYWKQIPEAEIRQYAAQVAKYTEEQGQELDMRTALEVGYMLAEQRNPLVKELKELRAAKQVEAEKAEADAARRLRSPRGVPGRAVPRSRMSLDEAVQAGMSSAQKR